MTFKLARERVVVSFKKLRKVYFEYFNDYFANIGARLVQKKTNCMEKVAVCQ